MQLAADPILIEIAGEAYELRPTLLAATILARRHGDFATLYKRILSDHVSATVDVIRVGSDFPGAADDFLHSVEDVGLKRAVAPLKLPLLRFVLRLAGHDDATPDTVPAASGKPIPFADYHAELFGIGTGWLGWTPADTWAATPAEIIAAQRGRTALIGNVLKAVFGSGKDATAENAPHSPELVVLNPDGTDPRLDRAGLNKLKSVAG